MRQIFIIPALLLTLSTSVDAQKCLTTEKVLESMALDPMVAQRMAEVEAFTQSYMNDHRSEQKTTGTLVVPVVVHILYISPDENITDVQVLSEFPVLKAAFSNSIFTAPTIPPVFQALAANIEIEFCLARTEPDGSPSSGITRKAVPATFDGEKDYYDPAKQGVAPWDPKKYVNVYLVRLNSTHLGFTYKPATAPRGQEGIVIDTKAWGNTGTAMNNPPYNLGLTAVHEFGHYFNLDHPWGFQGGCNTDDGISDTPPQYGPTWGCPTFPKFDGCTPGGDGIMFMNFMDYTDDICSSMFTQIQKLRMKAALAGPLAGLANPYTCYAAAVSDAAGLNISIAPNPAGDLVTIQINRPESFHADIISCTGAVVLSADAEKRADLPVAHLPDGLYFIRLTSQARTITQKLVVRH